MCIKLLHNEKHYTLPGLIGGSSLGSYYGPVRIISLYLSKISWEGANPSDSKPHTRDICLAIPSLFTESVDSLDNSMDHCPLGYPKQPVLLVFATVYWLTRILATLGKQNIE